MVPVVGQGAMATKYVSELDKIEGHGNNIADNVSTHIDDYVSRLYSKVTPSNRPANLFEIEQTGIGTIESLEGDINSYEGTVILEAKFVDKKSRSPFIEDSKIPPFLREKIRKEQAHEFERLKAVLKDSEVPFNKLEVRINEPLAKPYFQSLIEKYKIPGHVKVVRTSIKESGGG